MDLTRIELMVMTAPEGRSGVAEHLSTSPTSTPPRRTHATHASALESRLKLGKYKHEGKLAVARSEPALGSWWEFRGLDVIYAVLAAVPC